MSEQDSNFFRTFVLVLVLLGVFMVVIIVLANKITESENTSSPLVQAQINKIISPAGEIQTSVATTTEPVSTAPSTSSAGSSGPIDGKSVFQHTCFACHGTGVAGAPKAGDKTAWAPHVAKGLPTLYKHAIHGFTGKAGTMPAKGGNSALSDAQVKAAVNYMVGLVDPALFKKVEVLEKKTEKKIGKKHVSVDEHLALGKKVFSETCFACHGTGVAGAPKAGDKAAWAPHVAKGLPTLYKHAIHGFTGKAGTMPAKGGNPALSDTEVKAAVDYMVSLVK